MGIGVCFGRHAKLSPQRTRTHAHTHTDDGDAGLDGDHTADAHSLMQPRHVFNASAGAEEYGEEWMEHLGGGEGERLSKDESFDASALNISDIVRKTDMARRRGPALPESLWDQHNLEAAPGADDASLGLGEKRKAGAVARSAKRAKRSTSSDDSDDVSLGESEEATEAVRLYGSVGDTLPGARAPLSYSRAERKRPKPWSQREVARLLNALSMFGSNFNTIVHMFPGRTVKDVRRRYKQEYDRNPKRVMRALTERKPVNQEKFNRYKELSTTVKKIRNEMENGDTTENPLQVCPNSPHSTQLPSTPDTTLPHTHAATPGIRPKRHVRLRHQA